MTPDLGMEGRKVPEGRLSRPARTPLFRQVTFVGLGLINGSIARDVRRLGLAERLVGTARRAETRSEACALGLVDEATPDAAAAVREADLVVFGVPVGASGDAARAVAPGLRADAIVTDVGSAKGKVIELVAPHLDMRRFVPGHPVAGTEESGPAAAIERLFENRWCILTPQAVTDAGAVEQVAALWRALGSRVEVMDPAHHDKVLAITSHLPHLLAFNIVNTADDLEGVLKGEVLKYAAGGFTDFTRIAASDPTMWRDVFLHNKAAVLEIVGRYIEDLMALQRAIRWDEGDALFERFKSAQAIRREVVRAGQAYKRVPSARYSRSGSVRHLSQTLS
jgi:cyclohexadieny/prephenate dehydrogenase